MKKLLKKDKGMFTVEAVLIFPVIFLSILAIIYISILKYQNVVSLTEATRSANRVSAYWSYLGDDNPPALRPSSEVTAEDLITKDMYENRPIYRIIEAVVKTGKREANGQKYLDSRIKGIKFNPYSVSKDHYATLSFETFFLVSYIKVTVNKEYTNPLGKMLSMFGIGSSSLYEDHSTAVMTNTPEFIRNWDTIVQVGEFLTKGIE